MQAGDKVRLIGIPPNLRDEGEMQTLTLFQKCLGQSFTVDEVRLSRGCRSRSRGAGIPSVGKSLRLSRVSVRNFYFFFSGGAGMSELKMSATVFHLPSACVFQTSTSLPWSVTGLPWASFMVNW
jgi:hypothetical protein